jgi:hypothetical protein
VRALTLLVHPGTLALVALGTLASTFAVGAETGCTASDHAAFALLFVSAGAAAASGLSLPLHPDTGDVISKGSVLAGLALGVIFGTTCFVLGGVILVVIVLHHCPFL